MRRTNSLREMAENRRKKKEREKEKKLRNEEWRKEESREREGREREEDIEITIPKPTKNTVQDDVWEVFAEYFDMMTPEGIEPDEGLKSDLVQAIDEKFREHGYFNQEEVAEVSW